MRPYILEETNWKTIRDQEIKLAVLPWGATEAHNLHLPFSTDNVMVRKIASDSAEAAWHKGARPREYQAIPFRGKESERQGSEKL